MLFISNEPKRKLGGVVGMKLGLRGHIFMENILVLPIRLGGNMSERSDQSHLCSTRIEKLNRNQPVGQQEQVGG